jgi:DNA polymerase IIIc chi subunit
MRSEIFFTTVHDAQAKLKAITHLATLHFKKKEKLLILVADKAALYFVDQLLWRFPEESFLPHTSSENPSEEELIVISQKNIACFATLNLCPYPCFSEAKIVYELEDLTSADREKLAKERYQAYRDAKHPINLF